MKPIIKVDQISKKYRKGEVKLYYSLRETLTNIIQRPSSLFRSNTELSTNEFWALKNISFQVKPGEIMGIVGKNGAGKTTLLKILSRITTPTKGKAVLHGRVGSLLEVGTGFHQELTGLENIYLNGVILGMTRNEVSAKLEKIISFAEVEEFIDTPIKHYSSGMRLRLAFSVAAHLQPEILLVDEVLAVGDAEFQQKCLKKMGNIAQEGRTVLLVSHDMRAIQKLCNRTIYLEDGQIVDIGPTADIIKQYLSSTKKLKSHYKFPIDENKKAQITEVSIYKSNEKSALLDVSEPFRIQIKYQLNQKIPSAELKVIFKTPQGKDLFITSEKNNSMIPSREKGVYSSNLLFTPQKQLSFNARDYELFIKLTQRNQVLDQQNGIYISFLDKHSKVTAVNQPPHRHDNVLAFLPEWQTNMIINNQ